MIIVLRWINLSLFSVRSGSSCFAIRALGFFLGLSLLSFGVSFAESEVILPKISSVTLSETFSVILQVSSEKPPSSFILSHVEGPKLENVSMVDSKISTNFEFKAGKPLFAYKLEWHFKPLGQGLATVTLPTLTFQDDKGVKEEKKFADVFKIDVVPWHRKHRVGLGIALGALIILGVALLAQRKIKIASERRLVAEREIAFKQLKISREREAREKAKGLSILLISGEYGTYCQKLLEIFSEYMMHCNQLTHFPKDVGELRHGAVKYFDEAFHARLKQWLDLIEQIQFGSVRPLSGDLDRLPQLMVELIAIHREHGIKPD